MISPDNSEAGVHPPLADHQSSTNSKLMQQAMSNNSDALLRNTNNYALAGMPTLMTMPSSGNAFLHSSPQAGGLLSYHHGQLETTEQANKRLRLDVSPPPPVQQQLLPAAATATGTAQRKKSQVQIDRRRERNRILARRTRLRKKFFFESLQKEVMDLQRENEHLKEICQEELAEDECTKILDECNAMELLPPSILEQCAQEIAMDNQDMNLVKSIQKSQYAFCITDPSLPDNPIVYASDDFLNLTGYTREQVLGRNCRFLQGTDTNPEHVKEIRQAIAVGEDVSVTIVNYTSKGSPFWNKLFIAALRDSENNIVNYIGVIVPVAGPDPTGASGAAATAADDDEGEDEEDDDGAY
jgi:PAS domain S-box-containing protein